MENRVFRKSDDFRQFKEKVFFHTVLLVVIAVGCIYLLYSILLKGRFADWIVTLNQKVFRLDYTAARTLPGAVRSGLHLVFSGWIILRRELCINGHSETI